MASQVSASDPRPADTTDPVALGQAAVPSDGFSAPVAPRPLQPDLAASATSVSNSFTAIESDDGRQAAVVTSQPPAAPSGSESQPSAPVSASDEDFFGGIDTVSVAPAERDNTYVAPVPLATLPPQPMAQAPVPPPVAVPQPAFNLADIPTGPVYDGGTLPQAEVIGQVAGLQEFLGGLREMVASLGQVRNINAAGTGVYAGGALSYMSAMQERAQQMYTYAQGGISPATLQYLKSEVTSWFASLNTISVQSNTHVEAVRSGVVRAVRDGVSRDEDDGSLERHFDLRREVKRTQDLRDYTNNASV